jgi:hypothetical protein
MNVPKLLIAIFIVVGAAIDGVTGAVLGGIAGVVFNIVIGTIVNTSRGGLMPRNVRRSLAINVIANQQDALMGAFPGVEGAAVLARVEECIEVICQDAAATQPPGSDIHNLTVLTDAAIRVQARQKSPELAAFYRAIQIQMLFEWAPYPSTGPSRGAV